MKKLSPETQQSIKQIQELAAYREDYIRKKGLRLSFIVTCRKIGILPSTVKRHAPELYEKWENLDFHWVFPDK